MNRELTEVRTPVGAKKATGAIGLVNESSRMNCMKNEYAKIMKQINYRRKIETDGGILEALKVAKASLKKGDMERAKKILQGV